MHILNTNIHLDQFFSRLTTTKGPYLLLDFDGTLAPFHTDPAKVMPYPGVVKRLNAIALHTTTKLYLISGRGLDSLLAVMPKVHFCELWASHGAERLVDGKYWQLPLTTKQQNGLKAAQLLATNLPQGSFCEQKPLSVAVHWRGINDKKARKAFENLIIDKWTQLIQQTDLALHFFNEGIEIRPKEMSKATAVTKLLSTIPLDSTPSIAYLGDDATDEEAFMALGSHGLKVLVRPDIPKTTQADLQLIPPAELLDFLDQWLQNMESKT